MAIQFSVAVRNSQRTARKDTIGASFKIQIRTGSQAANCAAAASGSLLAEFTADASPWDISTDGQLALADLPLSVAATGTGTAGHYRVLDSGGTCHEHGSVTATGGGGDMEIDNTSIASGQTVRITAKTQTEAGA